MVSECVIAGHEVRVGAQRRAERLRGGHRLAVVLEGHSEAVVRQREGGILLGRFLKAGNGAGETVVRLGIGFVPSLEVAPGFESLAERLKRIPRRRHPQWREPPIGTDDLERQPLGEIRRRVIGGGRIGDLGPVARHGRGPRHSRARTGKHRVTAPVGLDVAGDHAHVEQGVHGTLDRRD